MKVKPRPDARARKAALRAQLEARRAAARAELERRRAGLKRPEKKKDRRRWWLLLLLLLLLLLFRDCRCQDPPVPPEEPPAPAASAPTGGGGIVEPPAPTPARIAPRRRPAYVPPDPGPLPWLDALRLQVAARGPRLAACFQGAERPGALKWSTSVDPSLGRVSEMSLEPVLGADTPSVMQRDCALAVLSSPDYKLQATGEERATPVRVSLVVEF